MTTNFRPFRLTRFSYPGNLIRLATASQFGNLVEICSEQHSARPLPSPPVLDAQRPRRVGLQNRGIRNEFELQDSNSDLNSADPGLFPKASLGQRPYKNVASKVPRTPYRQSIDQECIHRREILQPRKSTGVHCCDGLTSLMDGKFGKLDWGA